jgi:hypothetical protein
VCTGRWGFCRIFKHFSGFEFFLLPNRIHARPGAGTQAVGLRLFSAIEKKIPSVLPS